MAIQGSGQIPDPIVPIRQANIQPVGGRKQPVQAPEPQQVPADQVTLSSRARQVQTLASKVEQVSDVRDQRVEEIKAQIDAQTYNVPASKVAEKLLLEN